MHMKYLSVCNWTLGGFC